MAEIPPEWRRESDPWEKSSRLERENDELARGILELQRKLTITETARKRAEGQATHWWGAWLKEGGKHTDSRRELGRQRERTKYAEDKLQSAVNLGEMWHGRCQKEHAKRKKAGENWTAAQKGMEGDVRALRQLLNLERNERAELDLPLAYFPAGEEPEARWGLTELGRAAMRGGLLFREKKIREAMEPLPAPLEGFQGSIIAKAWERDGARYDLAAVCARCGRPYREHLEPEGPECNGFLASTKDEVPASAPFEACRLLCPIADRAPSTMPLCNQCWRKDP